jgi:hypothetical protein
MRALNPEAQRVLESLIVGLPSRQVGSAHRFNARPSTYMAVSVERIAPDHYSVAHYGEQNGDLMRDPEMCFWRGPDGRFYPTYFRNDYVGRERESVIFNAAGAPARVYPRWQADQACFAATWFRNIAHQQADALSPTLFPARVVAQKRDAS